MKKAADTEKEIATIFANLQDIECPILDPNADVLRLKMYGVIVWQFSNIDVINKVITNELR